ncbi:hypothetical protein BT67DRAFT_275361 [Trichocladium antarcticum]|uniref:Uncharacterized protein n=1 Tax=Trichocladium antarcticum TaxID=1450529 RepID=A0AAN6ULT8_9PEZI|nr:hypothetical protein BT67DRAFT_275361 [Trichocladium antarcticum]
MLGRREVATPKPVRRLALLPAAGGLDIWTAEASQSADLSSFVVGSPETDGGGEPHTSRCILRRSGPEMYNAVPLRCSSALGDIVASSWSRGGALSSL